MGFTIAPVRKLSVSLLIALALGACSQERAAPASAPGEAGKAGRVAYAMDSDRAVAEPPPGGGAPAEGGVLLAYSYSMGIEAPKAEIAGLVSAHQAACAAAGPAVCQVLGSSVNAYGDDQVSGYLSLRAEPKWLEAFRGGVASDAERSGGKLVSNAVSTEDLTQFIVDSEARLQAKKALRERIRTLLETREGSLSDVLAAERELANVQGEIDAMTASLAAARARVSMSALSISYQSDPETSVSMWKPLVEAFAGFGRASAASVAEAVNFVARTWPYFLIGLFVLWVLRAWLRGWRKARAKT